MKVFGRTSRVCGFFVAGRAAILVATIVAASFRAAASDDDTRAAMSLVDECVEAIVVDSYRPLTKPQVYGGALSGLLEALGPRYADLKRSLLDLPDAQARDGFQESLVALSQRPGQRLTIRELAETGIQAFCRSIDDYSRYITPADYALVKTIRQPDATGIGMTVMEKAGDFVCFPYQGSSAAAAGIRTGDRLLAINGSEIKGQTLMRLASQVRGTPGSEVELRIERTFGRSEIVRVRREAVTTPAIVVEDHVGGYTIRIRKFDSDVVREMEKALQEIPMGHVLTIDLRSCPGGSLESAVALADLFLEQGELVATLKEKGKPVTNYLAESPRKVEVSTVLLLQDEGTASAAEVFIAALVQSDSVRAVSQGKTTYGKSMVQKPVELVASGGRLEITSGELLAPEGQSWEGVGLLPSLPNRGKIFADAP